MNKHRICTTISSKHWEILNNYTKQYETQQKVLEFALENMDSKQKNVISPEEKLWLRMKNEIKPACFFHRDLLKSLIDTADINRLEKIIADQKPAEYMIVWYYQKPLSKCSPKETIEGLIFFIDTLNIVDTINYSDDASYYSLKIVHSLNINSSKLLKLLIENLFDSCGVKTESEISQNSVFMKIYKK